LPGIFLSYRRDDSQGWVGRLAERLHDLLPDANVFQDLASIRPGEDFVVAIEAALSSCPVLLALIGPRWLSAQADGRRRLDDPNDFVRLEIATALERRTYVIPVLVGGAALADAASLPESLRQLARRQAHELSDTRWDYDCQALIELIAKQLGSQVRGRRPASGPTISVGEGLRVGPKGRVGSLAGVSTRGAAQISTDAQIEVAKNAHIDGEVASIAGVDSADREAD
jgi:hypothetical protein